MVGLEIFGCPAFLTLPITGNHYFCKSAVTVWICHLVSGSRGHLVGRKLASAVLFKLALVVLAQGQAQNGGYTLASVFTFTYHGLVQGAVLGQVCAELFHSLFAHGPPVCCGVQCPQLWDIIPYFMVRCQ